MFPLVHRDDLAVVQDKLAAINIGALSERRCRRYHRSSEYGANANSAPLTQAFPPAHILSPLLILCHALSQIPLQVVCEKIEQL